MRESIISVSSLVCVLYALYVDVSNKAENDKRESLAQEKAFADDLKANIAKRKVKKFLKEMGTFFYYRPSVKTQSLQAQILLAQFIKESLNQTELATLKQMVASASRNILSLREKESILAELL